MKKIKIKDMYWKEQLKEISKTRKYFGSLWDIKKVFRYLNKLEKAFYCSPNDIKIVGFDTIEFTLPDMQEIGKQGAPYELAVEAKSDALLHILTTSPFPTNITYKKKINKLILWWN